jgi:hypothetical protein
MKWFRKTFVWASLGCVGISATAHAQQASWREGAIPLANEVRPASIGVSLGRPTPIAPESLRVVNAFVPIRQEPAVPLQRIGYVARGSRPSADDDAKSLFLPKDVPLFGEVKLAVATTQPALDLPPPPKDKAKIVEIENGKTPLAPEKIGAPRLSTPSLDPTERIIILDDGGHLVDEQGQSLFGLQYGGNQPFYVQGEWLLWATRGFRLPPLVTTASPLDPPNTRGALGFGTTQLLFGNSNTPSGLRSGARFTAGYNFDPDGLCALEANFFFLGRKNDNVTFSSDNFPVIGRPFFNINTGMQDRELTTTPEFNQGNLQVHMSSALLGAEVNKRSLICCGCDYQVTGIVGFRYLDLRDHLEIQENLTFINDVPGVGANPPIASRGDRVFVFDRFDTHNRFYGGQIGANAEWRRGCWSLDTRFKLALGATQQSVDIDGGQQIVRANGTVQNFQGGLLALPSNIGHFTQTRFAVVPEVGVKVGYNFTENLRVFVGYDFLYWSNVLRPGDQIDTSLDANRIPNFGAFPPANQVRPVVPFRTTSYWAMGLNAGLELRY